MITPELIGNGQFQPTSVTFEPHVQAKVDEYYSVNDLAGLKSLDVDLLARVNERPSQEDCYLYMMNTYRDVVAGAAQGVDTVRIRGFVVYYSVDKDTGKLAMPHVGVIVNNGRVRSKWGTGGHVFEHPVGAVPTIYGDRCLYNIAKV